MPGTHGPNSGDAPPQGDHHLKKRKRDDGDARSDRIPQPPPPQSGNGAPINYLSRLSQTKLPLVQGAGDSFSDILSLMSEYEGILNRHESLAANLGAKLKAPRFLRALDGLFDGPILVSPNLPTQSPSRDGRSTPWYKPTWLDVATFVKSMSTQMSPTTTAEGHRVYRFVMNNTNVEITEDDCQLIMSGTVDQFLLAASNPLEEDEKTELVTLDLLDHQVQILIKMADEVARKARQLNYRLSGRKAGIELRQSNNRQAVNPGFPGTTPGYDLHSDLLQQFSAPTASPGHQPANSIPSRPLSLGTNPPTQIQTTSRSQRARIPLTPSDSQAPHGELSTLPATGGRSHEAPSHQPQPPLALIHARIDRLNRGDTIYPPCDRCRRLKRPCVKKLTACDGCTHRHCKCAWTKLTTEEVASMLHDLNAVFPNHAPDNGGRALDADEEPPEDTSDAGRVGNDRSSRQRVGFTPTTTPHAEERRPDSADSSPRSGDGGPLSAGDQRRQHEHRPDVDGLRRSPPSDPGPKVSPQQPLVDPQLNQLVFTAINVARVATSATNSAGGSRGSSPRDAREAAKGGK